MPTPPKSTQSLPLVQTEADVLNVPQCDVLTVPCLTCNKKLCALNVRHHRILHRTLHMLQYRAGTRPVSLLSLRLRRRCIISKKMRSEKFSPLELQNIDFAYEIVKSNRLHNWPFFIENPIVCNEELPLPLRLPSTACVKSLGIWQDRNALWKIQMEDVYVFTDCYGGRSNAWFIGVFDGFHGKSAAQYTSKDLPDLILEQLANAGHPYTLSTEQRAQLHTYNPLFPPGTTPAAPHSKGANDHPYSSIHVAFAKAFWKMDKILLLGRNESSNVRWSGCTVATCLLEPASPPSRIASGVDGSSAQSLSEDSVCEIGTLHIANAGDVHAVLCRNGKGYRLTENHSTSNHQECKRILRSGGSISKNKQHGLVEGFIQSTRGLGFHGDPKLKTSIIPIPYTVSVPIDASCEFLVLASSGFWKVLTRREVVSISLEMLSFYFRSFHTKSREIRSVIHSLQVERSDDQIVEEGSTITQLLDEFSQLGHRDALLSLKHLFEELLGKKHGWKNIENIQRHFSLKEQPGSIWQAMYNLLQNVPTEGESPLIIDAVSEEPKKDNIFMNNSPEDTLNKENTEDKTTKTNFPEKHLPDYEVKNNSFFIEHSSEELLTKEKSSDDKIHVTPVTSHTENSNGYLNQENITKKTMKQKAVTIVPTASEDIDIENLYKEAYLMSQEESSEESSQEATDELQEIQYETLANTISKQLVETAKQAGACDNITVLIVLLPGCAKSVHKREETI
ncbi:protein phosphatase 2C-like domain-containing protein 1 [Scyliorhinus canicula]|uniref:protein phosphatase 2C-like domain-containing protein 1 n=1 Tax=Scyliorhinus canicula TaxID=7830 RepID=UPI0018F76C29|nr:protein phosphatase 2C-like domain-containing protein 1 [Scyliorhinus canicula]XP_038653787.1 protein phosphatase 2C-like domain-containing protein 1 [Scyliorhinus canicula]